MEGFVPLFRSSRGIDHYMRTNPDGSHSFASSQDTDPILENNKALANHNDGYGASRDLRRVASVPYILGLKWLHEEGWWFEDPDHADKLAKKLNDHDYFRLRTADGRLAVSNGVMR